MKGLNARVNDTNVRIERLGEDLGARIDKTNERLEQAIGRLDGVERRQSESEIRFMTELASVNDGIRDIRDAVTAGFRGVRKTMRTMAKSAAFEKSRVDRLEERVDALERRAR